MAVEGLGEMGGGAILDLAGERAESIREAETDLIQIAYQWAIIQAPDRLDPVEAGKAGREQARQYGGDGTPQVCEFAAAELGARIGRTTFAASQLMADALDLHHRGGDLWTRVRAGQVRASYARHVVTRTRLLPAEQATAVADAVATAADGRIPWTRFEALVEAKVAQADPAAARAREEKARKATFARKLRAELDGMGSYLIRGPVPVPVIDQIGATVTGYAAAIAVDHPDLTRDELDVEAVRLLLTPTGKGETTQDGEPITPAKPLETAPIVHLYLHGYTGPRERDVQGNPVEAMYRLEGHRMLTETYLRDVLGPTCRFKVYPVIDIEGQAPVDSYEIPDRHRQAVHLMTPADVFPYASNLSRKKQVDHTRAFDQGGVSGVGNYGPMTLTHHRIKTHGPWTVRQPFPGIYLWRDAHGNIYLVDHTGTRQLPKDHPGNGKKGRKTRYVEIYRNLPEIAVA